MSGLRSQPSDNDEDADEDSHDDHLCDHESDGQPEARPDKFGRMHRSALLRLHDGAGDYALSLARLELRRDRRLAFVAHLFPL